MMLTVYDKLTRVNSSSSSCSSIAIVVVAATTPFFLANCCKFSIDCELSEVCVGGEGIVWHFSVLNPFLLNRKIIFKLYYVLQKGEG